MEKNYEGCVLLHKSPIDKVAAKVLVERHQGTMIPVVQFWASPQCSDDQRLKWEEEEDVLAVDLGGDKYHFERNRVGSATEFAAKNNVSGETTPAEQKLIEMANKNNKTGYLKGFHMAIAWTMRELYELDEYDHVEVVERVGHVIHMWLDFTDGKGLDHARDDAGMAAHFADLLEELHKCSFAPFTPHSYLRHLWRLGYQVEEIREKVSYWVDGWKSVKRMQAETAVELEKMDTAAHEFTAGPFRGFWAETANKFLTKAVTSSRDGKARRYQIVIVKNPDGHGAFLTDGLDVTRLADEILSREPGRWYHTKDQGFLINGGVIYKDTEPTGFDIHTLVELAKKYPPRRPHESRPYLTDHGFANNPHWSK